MVSLSRGVFVEAGVVNNTARRAVSLGGNHHPRTPGDWSVDRNSLQDAQPDVSVQAVLDSCLPVKRNLTGTVNSSGPSLLVNKDPDRR